MEGNVARRSVIAIELDRIDLTDKLVLNFEKNGCTESDIMLTSLQLHGCRDNDPPYGLPS